MDESDLYGKKKKKIPKCANPLFVEWLREWHQEAADKGAKSQYTYKKALNSLMRFPLRLETGKDCKILENFGDRICKMLDDKLQKHITEHGTYEPVARIPEETTPVKKTENKSKANKMAQGEITKIRRNKVAVHELSDSDSDSQTQHHQPARKRQKSGKDGERDYIPVYRSGPYALLLALYQHMQDPDSTGYLSKTELISKAQVLADKSFTLPDPGSRYTAWSSMGTLIKKGLVVKESSPARYSLTDKGCELAHKLKNVQVHSDDDTVPFRINEPDLIAPPPNEAPPPRLPTIHGNRLHEVEEVNHTVGVPMLSNKLKYWYITADDREVIFKDEAMVTVEDDFGVGFLVKCNYTAVLQAGVKYKLDTSRPHRDDFCYLYLCNEDAVDIANPPYSHLAHNDRQAQLAVPEKTLGTARLPAKSETESQKEKPKHKMGSASKSKTSKHQGLQLLPLVSIDEINETGNQNGHSEDLYKNNEDKNMRQHNTVLIDIFPIDSDEECSQDSVPSVTKMCQNIKTVTKHIGGLLPDSEELSQHSIQSLTESSQSSVGSGIPEPNFILRPGQFDIVLCVDNAEFYGGTKGSSKTLLPDLMKNGIQCDLRKLHVGDILWMAKERVRPLPGQLENPKGRELVLNYIIERKRMDDLVSSCIDGRFKEQKFRLKKCGLKHLIYLIEDHGSMQHFSIPEATIRQAITNTQVIDEFQVKRTKDSKETVAFLTVLTRYLQSSFQGKTLYAASIESIKEVNITYSIKDTEQRLPTFEEFNQGSVKSKALTVREMFGKQLIQIYGMSAEKALAVTEKYPTPAALLRAYRNCTTEKEKENLLSLIKCGKSNRCLGTAQSKQIFQLYNNSAALQYKDD